MRPPSHVIIGPHDYKVCLVPAGVLEGAGADATCMPRRLTFALDDGMPPTQKADGLLHEVTHAILEGMKLDDDVNEAIALLFGPGLLALILDNPDLIDWIVSLR